MLYRNVVQGTNHNVTSVQSLMVGLVNGRITKKVDSLSQLVLYQNKCFHSMMECEVMLVHLRQYGANIEMDLTGIADDEWLLDPYVPIRFLRRIIQALVLYLQSFLQIRQSISQFLGFSEQTSHIIIGYCSDSIIAVLGVQLCFFEKLLAHFEIVSMQVSHCEDVANDRDFFANVFLFYWEGPVGINVTTTRDLNELLKIVEFLKC